MFFAVETAVFQANIKKSFTERSKELNLHLTECVSDKLTKKGITPVLMFWWLEFTKEMERKAGNVNI